MEWKKIIDSVESREDFLSFVQLLAKDFRTNPVEWENDDLERYLAALHRWTTDMDGYFANSGQKTAEPSWKVFATILYAAKIYE